MIASTATAPAGIRLRALGGLVLWVACGTPEPAVDHREAVLRARGHRPTSDLAGAWRLRPTAAEEAWVRSLAGGPAPPLPTAEAAAARWAAGAPDHPDVARARALQAELATHTLAFDGGRFTLTWGTRAASGAWTRVTDRGATWDVALEGPHGPARWEVRWQDDDHTVWTPLAPPGPPQRWQRVAPGPMAPVSPTP